MAKKQTEIHLKEKQGERMKRLAKKVLLVGWDAADWKVINKLMDEGKMPAMQSLVENGTMGNLSTLDPPFSPMLWTSIATGVRPHKHGILGFSEPDPKNQAVRPVSSTSRKVKAIWNILTQNQMKSNIVGWWPSHPVEPINGIMISNHYKHAAYNKQGAWPITPGTVHPPELSDFFAHFRIPPSELTVQHIQPFVPDFEKIDQDKDKSLESIAKITAEAASIQAASTAIMEMEEWDLMAVYFDAIDHYSHGFMNYNPPRLQHMPEDKYELFKGVVEAGYRFHDMMLARMIQMAGEDTTVIVISDHGFHPDHLRPKHLPDEPAGPAQQHRDLGIFVAKGPGIRKDEILYGASLLDITPTLLTLFGLPIGQDMDGVPLVQIFEDEVEINTIPSWEEVDGEAGMLPNEVQDDPIAAQEALNQLVELGYIEAPDENIEIAVKKTTKELKYNLGRVHLGASHLTEAEKIFTELYAEEPDQPRFALRLINCKLSLNKLDEADTLINEFLEYEKSYVATHNMKEISAEEMPKEFLDDSKHKEKKAWGHNKRKQINRLQQAHSDLLQLQVLKGDLLIKQNKPKQALNTYLQLAKISKHKSLNIQIGNALLKLKRWKKAEESFLNALEYDENSFTVHHGLSRAYTKLREYENAVEHGLTAIGITYQVPLAHYHLGEALLLYKSYDAAENAFNLALNMNPNLGQARNYLIYLYDHILNSPQKSIAHKNYFKKRGIDISSPEDEGFDDLEFETDKALTLAEKDLKKTTHPTKTDNNNSNDPIVVRRTKDLNVSPITIVSGLPRSGTSMMMQMLDAGGLPIFTDKKRAADESNPKGYYEHEAVKSLARNASWVKDTPGKVVKVISHLLPHLPARYVYKIIFMERDIKEVVTSQHTMLVRNGVKKVKADAYPFNIEQQYLKNLEQIKSWESNHHNVEVLRMSYSEALENPAESAQKVAHFLDRDMDINKMASTVDRTLYRTKME